MTPEARRRMLLHDGELEPAEVEALQAELEQEPRARAELARHRMIGELVRAAYQPRDPGPELTESILARTFGEPKRARTSIRRRLAVAVPLAAGLALAALVALVVRPPRQAPPEAARIALAPAPRPSVAPLADPALTELGPSGVSIQSVDFGATQGAIFMVSGGESETMVVWTLEDADDKG